MSRRLGWRLLAVIALLGTAAALVLLRPAQLGLDLRGGTQIVLEASDTARQRVDSDTVDRTLEVLRRRVDQLGVAEPTLQRSGERRVIGRTAQLAFHPVLATPQGGQQPAAGELALADEQGARLRLGPAALGGGVVGDARAELDPQVQTRWQVAIEFRGAGGRQWAQLTGKAACQPSGDPRRRVAIVLDRQVISSPQVDPSVQCGQGISGGSTVITGDFTDQQARELALLIRAGALPVPVEVVEQRTVGPTLGAEAIAASTQAAVIGVALTIVFMAAYYRLLGGVSAVALGCYGLLLFAVLLGLRSTLTLPGIAGFVLAIGMAVDANVLVFERMKEEHRAGAGLRPAVDRGFRNALSAIADSNVTTLLAAVLLFFLASGAVRGFGVTLSVGVVVSLFTALVVTRVLVELAIRWRAVAQRPRPLGIETGGRLCEWIATRRPNLVVGRAGGWRGRRRCCCWRWRGWWCAAPAWAWSSPAGGCWSTRRGGRSTLTWHGQPWPARGLLGRWCRSPATATWRCGPASSTTPASGGSSGRSSRSAARPSGSGRSSSARPSARSCAARPLSRWRSRWPRSWPTWRSGSAGRSGPRRWWRCSTTWRSCWGCSPGSASRWMGCSWPCC